MLECCLFTCFGGRREEKRKGRRVRFWGRCEREWVLVGLGGGRSCFILEREIVLRERK